MKKGTTAIGGVFNGTTEIAKIMKNNVVVYENRLLPYGYRQLEYIQSTGTQYIDTGVTGNLNTRAVIDFDFILNNSTTAFSIFGARTSASNNDNVGIIWGVYQSKYGLNLDFGNYTSYRLFYETYNENTKYRADISKSGRYLYDSEGELIGSNTTANTTEFTSPSNLLLFKEYGEPSMTRGYTGKIYSCKLYNGNTLIRKFIPCKNLLGTVGMYDTVGKQFYANAGTGDFVAGPEIKLPDGYSYIEATGTQYIDTGFSPDSNTQVDYKVETTSGAFDASPFIGTRLGSSNNNRFFPIAYLNVQDTCRSAFGLTTIQLPVSGNTVFEGSFRPKSGVSIINGMSYDISNASFQKVENNNLYIFATSGYSSNLYQSHGKMYYCKIYDNGTLIRNYIPCKNDNNEIGMYDLINGVFYSNQGTGSFIGN